MEASCCVARKLFLSAARASSRARTLDSRPTTNGVIMKGKMTTSRMGIIGSFLLSNFSLDVVTESPWDPGQTNNLTDSTLPQRPLKWLLFCGYFTSQRLCLEHRQTSG